jgi:Zn-dependent metalloprotease
MKKRYSLFFICSIGLATTLLAQDSFLEKKKRHASQPVTKSLNAQQIDGSAASQQARSSSSTQFAGTHSLSPAFLKRQGNPAIYYNSENGLPIFIETPVGTSAVRTRFHGSPEEACFAYLDELKSVLRIENGQSAFRVQSSTTDAQNKMHIKLQQVYKGVPVYGSELIAHMTGNGSGEALNGRYEKIPEGISTTPSISQERAIAIATQHLKPVQPRHFGFSLPDLGESHATLYIYADKQLITSYVLAYHVVTYSKWHRWEYFVDAGSGNILKVFDSTCFADGPRTATANDLNNVSRTINTYQIGSNYFLIDAARKTPTGADLFKPSQSTLPDNPVGGILTINMNNTFGNNQTFQHVTSTNNTWSNTSVSAHFNAGVAFEYFKTNHSRNSINGQGGTIISIINVPDLENGTPLDNAFWNGKAMFYGNGASAFKPLAGSMDVAGHEMTHGVVENTANLEYQGESGAINESMADVFGAMMDPDGDWQIGEDVVKTTAYPSGALRSLSDPHNGGSNLNSPGFQPKNMSEKYNGTEDNGGVHINSGIPNHAFFKFAQATTKVKAAAIFYKALNDYLTKSSQFIDLRLAVIKAATDLHGNGSAEVTQAGLAFDAVGITNGTGSGTTPDYDVNPGTEYLLVDNTDPADINTLYRTSASGTNFAALSKTVMLSRPSVTDNGEVAIFVASDNTLHAISTKPNTPPNETVISSETIWSNAVVAKDGSKLAAVTTGQDSSIYVYDFASKEWGRYVLYNPTYTQGVSSGGPIFADALEWDYTGQYLVYDALNALNNSSGEDILYWDVGFIKVWDNKKKDFGTGEITKLFTSLPEGVSIGNPSFSKLSPNVIAFDFFDEFEQLYQVLGCNIETNDVKIIADNSVLGYPSFNKNDTRIAFTSSSGSSYTINYIALMNDKISPNGNVIGLLTDARWPVYFAIGEREYGDVVTSTEDAAAYQSLIACYPNPFDAVVEVALKDGVIENGSMELLNLRGQSVSYFVKADGNTHVARSSDLAPGIYLVRVQTNQGTGTCRLVKRP